MIHVTIVKENWFLPAKYATLRRITKLIEFRQQRTPSQQTPGSHKPYPSSYGILANLSFIIQTTTFKGHNTLTKMAFHKQNCTLLVVSRQYIFIYFFFFNLIYSATFYLNDYATLKLMESLKSSLNF